MGNKNVPSIRFKGFLDDWEQRKLGEAVTFLNGRAYKQKELLDKGKYRVLRVGNFNTNDFWYYSDLELEDNKYADKGDLLYLWATNFGPEIWKEERVIYHYHIWKLNINDVNLDKNYLYTWLITDKERIKQTTNGTTMVHVTKGGMEERLFQNPTNIDEQIKIGNFFKKLDETITLQERELELLKLTKKGFLQQLFTDNQQKFPNIRFANFHDEWQQRKLGDTLLFLKSGLSRLFSNIDIGLPVVRANNINNGILNMKNDVKYWYQIDTKGAKNENYYIHKNDILINFINSEAKMGTAAVVREEPARETIYTTNILKAQVNKDYEHYFWFSLTQINKYKNDIKLITKPAVNQASFTTVDFKKLSYKFPNIDEQAKIGSFFKQLDETILIQERKLEKLKRLKKAFLQKMFI